MINAVDIEAWQELEDTRQDGEIEKIIHNRGYGFLVAEDGRRYFWHLTALMNKQFTDLRIGEAVSFVLRDTGHAGGPIADRIYSQDNNNIIKGDNDNEDIS
jgi:cold shock CspA family protein